MTPEELEREYQKQAGLANAIGLSVPVALQLQTVILLQQILLIVSKPPIIVPSTDLPPDSKPFISKKDSRT